LGFFSEGPPGGIRPPGSEPSFLLKDYVPSLIFAHASPSFVVWVSTSLFLILKQKN
jgi:hypothetical protein